MGVYRLFKALKTQLPHPRVKNITSRTLLFILILKIKRTHKFSPAWFRTQAQRLPCHFRGLGAGEEEEEGREEDEGSSPA